MRGRRIVGKVVIIVILFALVCVIFVACDSFNSLFDDKTYYVTLDLGDNVIKWKQGDPAPIPTKDGYYFAGWYSEKECENQVAIDFATYKPLDDLYLYAKWIKLNKFENITFEDLTVIYDGNAHGIDVLGVPEGAKVNFITENSYTLPGQYEVIVEISKERYRTLTLSAILRIEPLVFDNVTFDSVNVDYDGKEHCVEVMGAPVGAIIEYNTNNSHTMPGVYNISATISMIGYQTKKIDATLTINALEFEGITFDRVVTTYDGNPHTLRVEGEPNGAHVQYNTVITYTNAGTYKVSATITKAGYNPLTLDSELVINKATIVGVVFDDIEVTWDGNVHSVCVLNLPNGVSVSYQNNDKTEVGEYQVVASFDTGNNYFPLDDMLAKLVIKELMHTISFVDGDGARFEIEVGHGKKIFEAPSPYYRDGYSAGWDKDITCPIIDDITVSAVYTPIVYSITYDFAGGYCQEAVTSYTIEDNVSLPKDNVLKQGYSFDGWYLSSQYLGDRVDGWQAEERVGDVKLYAKWKTTQYLIHYDLNCDDASIDSNARTTFDKDSGVILLTKPFRPTCIFLGWYCVEEDKIVDRIDAKYYNADIHLIAKWEIQKFNIIYQLEGGELNNAPTTFDNYTPIFIDNPTRDGYIFDGWLVNNKDKFTGSLVGYLKDVTLVAQWTPIVYHITYHVGIEDYYLKEENIKEFTIESKGKEFINPSKEHYNFLGWYSDSACTNRVYATEDYTIGDKEYFGKWEIIEYNVFYNTLLGENSTDNRTTYTIDDNFIILSAPSRLGYEFLGWYIADESDMQDTIKEEQWYDATKIVDSITASGGDIYLVARWKIIEYKITYLNVGACNNLNPTTFDINNCDIELLSLDDVNFDKWTLDGKEISRIDKSIIGRDITLCAVFKEGQPMDNIWTVKDGIITSYNGDEKEITIPQVLNNEKIIGVALGAFGDRASSIITLNFPSSIEIMQDGLLADFSSLVNLTIPFVGQTKYSEGFKGAIHSFSYLFACDEREGYIGVLRQPVEYKDSGFVCYEDGKYNYIPKTLENVKVLGGALAYRAFAYCTMIKSVTLVDCSVLEEQALRGCSGLERIVVESENTSFKIAVFAGSTDNLKEVSVVTIAQRNTLINLGIDEGIIECKES